MCKLASLIAIALTVTCAAASPDDGPFYAVSHLANSSSVQVTKLWMARGTDRVTRKQSFLVPLTLLKPAAGSESKDGEVRFGPARKISDDGWGQLTRVVPVRGTTLVVLATDDYRRRITVSVLDLSSGVRRQVASFPHEAQNPQDGACAITRSGEHILLAGPNKITIWDVVKWRTELAADGTESLSAIRTAMMKGTGNPGNWWLTDDLRYIIVDSTHCMWSADGEGPVYTPPQNVGGLKLDLANDAVMFDRKHGTLSRFVSEIPSQAGGALVIADAEDVGGKIELLYKLGPILDLRAAVADPAGQVKASHTVKSFLAELAGWDPEHDQVWFWTRDAHNSLPSVHPEADNHLIVWDVGADTEQRFRIPVDQIRRAVDAAK